MILLIIILILILVFIFNFESPDSHVDKGDVVFKSSFSSGGSLMVPHTLIFKPKKVVLVTNTGDLLTTSTVQTIPNKSIVGLNTTRFILGCNMLIIGSGFQNISLVGFTKKDTEAITKIIYNILDKK